VLVEPVSLKRFDRQQAHRIFQRELAASDLDSHLKVDFEVVNRLAPVGPAKFKRAISKVHAKEDVGD
jgi:hypothetical protein